MKDNCNNDDDDDGNDSDDYDDDKHDDDHDDDEDDALVSISVKGHAEYEHSVGVTARKRTRMRR